MEFKALAQFIELGVTGVALIGLLTLVFFILNQHKQEREEWRKDASERQKDTKEVLKELTTVIRASNDINRRQ